MTTLYSQITGNWSNPTTLWNTAANGSGAYQAATSADACIIQSGHTVTLDTTGCACSTLTINSGGTLTASTTASSNLTAQSTIVVSSGGTFNINLSGSYTYTCDIFTNAANSTSDQANGWLTIGDTASFTFKGFPKTRKTTLTSGISAGATSAVVTDATGWQIGDVVVFATTQAYNATPRTDVVTLTSVSGGTIGWTGGITYDHASGGYVGNFSSNVRFGPATSGYRSNIAYAGNYGTAIAKVIDNVAFNGGGQLTYNRGGVVSAAKPSGDTLLTVSNCAFYQSASIGIHVYGGSDVLIDGCVFYTSATQLNSNGSGGIVINRQSRGTTITGCGIFRNSGTATFSVATGGYSTGLSFSNDGYYYDQEISDTFVSGCKNGIGVLFNNGVVSNVEVFSNQYGAFLFQAAGNNITGLHLGTHNGGAATNSVNDTHGPSAKLVIQDSNTQTLSLTTLSTASTSHEVEFRNKNSDVTSQEIYRPYMQIKRDNSNNYRATSSIAIYPTVVSTNCQRTRKIPCANGKSIRAIGYVKKSHATNIAATVAITGLGITPVSFTKANDTAWEQFDLTATNSSGNDGNFTLTYTANSSSGTTNVAYFDGVPDDPFVTKCRHYGYRYDETNPARVVNPTVSANEATAAAYTGITVTGSTSAISLGSDRTFQILYDYTQAWACTTANLAYDVPLTGAGVAGNASLFAVGNVTTTGYTLNGAGSLDMGSLTLTASLPWVYTYTGGVFSQSASQPSFNGGTLDIGAAGTFTFTMAGSTIVSMTPTAPGTYAMGSGSFTGTIDLRNTSGTHAITVELPSGTSYTTANNTGATITVSVPTVSANISITGMPDAAGASCRLQVFNASAVSAAAWQATTPYSAGDMVLRTTGIGTESTAGLYMRCTTGGTSGGTEPTWNTTPGGTTSDGTVTWTTYKVLFHDADPASTSYATTYIDGEEFLAGETVTVRFAEMDAGTSFKRYSISTIPTASGFSVLVDETADEVYATNGLNGSSYESTFSPDFVANYIILDTNTDFSGKAAYAYFCYTLTTSNGMYRFWGGVTALDVGNYRVETDTLNLYFDESAGFVKQTDDVRIFRKDGVRPALDPTTGGNGIEMNWRVPVSVVSTGGSALTPTESAQLMSLTNAPSAATVADAVWSKTLP